MELELENLDETTKMGVIEALKKIIKDMTKLSAQGLMPKEEPMAGMEVEIEAKPLDEEEAKTKVKDAMGMMGETMEEDEEEEIELPRWKKRLKQEA
jgi:hypothetical protein